MMLNIKIFLFVTDSTFFLCVLSVVLYDTMIAVTCDS